MKKMSIIQTIFILQKILRSAKNAIEIYSPEDETNLKIQSESEYHEQFNSEKNQSTIFRYRNNEKQDFCQITSIDDHIKIEKDIKINLKLPDYKIEVQDGKESTQQRNLRPKKPQVPLDGQKTISYSNECEKVTQNSTNYKINDNEIHIDQFTMRKNGYHGNFICKCVENESNELKNFEIQDVTPSVSYNPGDFNSRIDHNGKNCIIHENTKFRTNLMKLNSEDQNEDVIDENGFKIKYMELVIDNFNGKEIKFCQKFVNYSDIPNNSNQKHLEFENTFKKEKIRVFFTMSHDYRSNSNRNDYWNIFFCLECEHPKQKTRQKKGIKQKLKQIFSMKNSTNTNSANVYQPQFLKTYNLHSEDVGNDQFLRHDKRDDVDHCIMFSQYDEIDFEESISPSKYKSSE